MNFPEGVTGLEPEIAGDDERETTVEGWCDNRPKAGRELYYRTTATETLIGSTVTSRWTCPFCGAEHSDTYDLAEVGL
jgi:hypothetical protein